MKWLLVDYGGVLADDGVASALDRLAKALGTDSVHCRSLVSERTPAGSALRLDKISELTFWMQIQEGARPGAALTRAPAELTEMWASTYRVRHTMTSLLKEVKEMGIEVAVATNVDRYREAYILRSLHAEGLDIPIFSSYQCRSMKPDPKYYKSVTDHLRRAALLLRSPHEVRIMFVDDRSSHTDAAASCGWETLCATDPIEIRTWLVSM